MFTITISTDDEYEGQNAQKFFRTRVLFTQTAETLDIPAVIAVVNDLEKKQAKANTK